MVKKFGFATAMTGDGVHYYCINEADIKQWKKQTSAVTNLDVETASGERNQRGTYSAGCRADAYDWADTSQVLLTHTHRSTIYQQATYHSHWTPQLTFGLKQKKMRTVGINPSTFDETSDTYNHQTN